MRLPNEGVEYMPWEELGKSQFSPTWVEITKQIMAFSSHGSNCGSVFTQ